jgi:hypothetical protein
MTHESVSSGSFMMVSILIVVSTVTAGRSTTRPGFRTPSR